MSSNPHLPVLDEAPSASPQRLDLKVGFACNNRCVFCVQGDKRDQIPPRSTAECRALLEEHRATSSGVVFTGGEASIRKDIVDIVAHAHGIGYEVIQLQTNGRRMAYVPFVEALVAAGLTEVSPALHGSTAAMHDALTRAPGAWAQCVRGIQNARRHGIPVITNTVVVQRNVTDLPALAELFVRLDVQQVQFAYVHPSGTAGELFDEVVPRFTDAMPHVRRALDIVSRAGIRGYAEAIPFCFMQGYEDFVVERHIPRTCVVDAPMVIADYTAYRWTEGKAKGPPCAQCSHVQVCEGPWHEYPNKYGWSEFVPRTDPPAPA